MTQTHLAWIVVCLVYTIFILGILSHMFGWNHTYAWLDEAMHALGGLWVGLAVLWLSRSYRFPVSSFCILGAVIGIGVLWEIFQYGVYSAFPASEYGGFVDSFSDVVFDTLGGLTAVTIYTLYGKQ